MGTEEGLIQLPKLSGAAWRELNYTGRNPNTFWGSEVGRGGTIKGGRKRMQNGGKDMGEGISKKKKTYAGTRFGRHIGRLSKQQRCQLHSPCTVKVANQAGCTCVSRRKWNPAHGSDLCQVIGWPTVCCNICRLAGVQGLLGDIPGCSAEWASKSPASWFPWCCSLHAPSCIGCEAGRCARCLLWNLIFKEIFSWELIFPAA